MKCFLYFCLLLGLSAQARGQAPANDHCSTPETLTIGPVTQWHFGNFQGATNSTDIRFVDSVSAQALGGGSGRKDLWYRFSSSRVRVKVKVKGGAAFGFQLVQGPCQALSEKFSRGYSNVNQVDSVIAGPIVASQPCYLRIYRVSTDPTLNTPFEFSVQESDIPNVFRSNIPGGLWSQTGTWLANRVPTFGDSVLISEASTVTMDVVYYYGQELAWLGVGGEDTTKTARLIGNYINSRSDIVVGRKDSVYGTTGGGTSRNVAFRVRKNLVLHGGIRADNMELVFRGEGNEKQRFYGSGGHRVKFCDMLFADNPGGIDLEFPLLLRNDLVLMQGRVNFLKPGRYHIGAGGGLFGDTNNTILRLRGKIEGDFSFTPSVAFQNCAACPMNYEYGLDGIWQSEYPHYKHLYDTTRSFGPEYYTGAPEKNHVQVFIPGYAGWKQTSGNKRFYGNSINGRWWCLGPQDTLFSTSFSGGNYENEDLAGYENATLCLEGRTGVQVIFGTSGGSKHLRKNGRVSSAGLFTVAGYTLPVSQRVCYDMLPQKPTGAFPAPITALHGQAVFYVGSNQALPDQVFRLSMYYNSSDSMVGNPYDLRLCQGPGPDGPWKVISDSLAEPIEVSQRRRKSRPIAWGDGHYFCWATTAKNVDMAPFKLYGPPAYTVGCPATPPQKVLLLTQNRGVDKALTYEVGYQFEGESPQFYTVTHAPGEEVRALQIDTIELDGPYGVSLPTRKIWNYKIWTTILNDQNATNDTLTGKLNYRGSAFPYLATFDTLPQYYVYGPGIGEQYPNLPFQWYDSIRNDQILARFPSGNFNDIFWLEAGYFPGDFRLHSRRRTIGKHTVYTNQIGPISQPSRWSFKYRIAPFNSLYDSAMLRPLDTVYFEASADCGVTWKRLWKLHRGNQVVRKAYQVATDSLPFPAGSFLVFRLIEDIETFNGSFNYGTISIDSLWFRPGLVVNTQPPMRAAVPAFRLSPNPVKDVLHIQVAEGEVLRRMEVFDVFGRRQSFEMAAEHQIRVQKLPPGVYSLRIQSRGHQSVERFVKE